MFDGVEDLRANALVARLGLVCCLFELAVEFTGGGENGQFPNASSQSRLVSKIMVERPGVSRQFGTVQQDTARAPQTSDRSPLGVDEAVIRPPPCIIQLLTSRQRLPAQPDIGSTSPGYMASLLQSSCDTAGCRRF